MVLRGVHSGERLSAIVVDVLTEQIFCCAQPRHWFGFRILVRLYSGRSFWRSDNGVEDMFDSIFNDPDDPFDFKLTDQLAVKTNRLFVWV